MLILIQDFKISRFQDYKNLITFQDFKMSIFQDFEIFQDFNMSIFQDFGIFQDFKISRFHEENIISRISRLIQDFKFEIKNILNYKSQHQFARFRRKTMDFHYFPRFVSRAGKLSERHPK